MIRHDGNDLSAYAQVLRLYDDGYLSIVEARELSYIILGQCVRYQVELVIAEVLSGQ